MGSTAGLRTSCARRRLHQWISRATSNIHWLTVETTLEQQSKFIDQQSASSIARAYLRRNEQCEQRRESGEKQKEGARLDFSFYQFRIRAYEGVHKFREMQCAHLRELRRWPIEFPFSSPILLAAVRCTFNDVRRARWNQLIKHKQTSGGGMHFSSRCHDEIDCASFKEFDTFEREIRGTLAERRTN